MLDQCNPHVKAFRSARDRFDVEGSTGYRMRLIESRQSDGRTHNLPTANEVAALIPGDFVLNMETRDIVLESTSGKLQRISELHPAYLPLQYPLLFPYGEDGFRLNIPIGFEDSTARKRKNVTMREYFAFRILERRWEAPTITRSGRLFHQFLVDAYTMIESSRLRYLWLNQKKLRSSSYAAIQKAATRAGAKMAEQGSRIFIPATFTGEKVMYTIEFQKEECHTLIFLSSWKNDQKFPTADDIDKIISAEIPDKTVDPDLYVIVGDCMMHGPCGAAKKDNVCMVNGKCSKMFRKPLNIRTSIDANGFPAYMRRIDGRFIEKNGIRLDNGFVVPYNRDLMLRYRVHMNVEWCVQTRAVKYLFKYIHKGPDYASAAMGKEDEDGVIDEIKTYYDCRYITACESSWRILAFPTHFRTTSVEKLGFHLPDQELVRENGYHGNGLCDREDCAYSAIRGPTSYEDIRTVDGVFLYHTYEDACYALGLMDDDKEFIEAIKDASDCSSATYARKLFARMLVSKSLSQPHVVWEATWEYLTDDILYKKRRETGRPDMNLTIEQIKNIALTEIENHLLSNGRSLKKWAPHAKARKFWRDYNGNRLIDDELNYVVEDQLKENERLMAMITDEQRGVYEQILDAVLNDSGGVFFLYGYGGTEKPSYTEHSRQLSDLKLLFSVEISDRFYRLYLEVVEQRLVLAALNSSYLWEHCKVLKLTKNMRLLAGLTDDAAKELESFSNWILDIGDGKKINLPNDGQVEIDIPSDLLIQNSGEDPIETMAKEVYGQAFQNFNR
ncbi:uncharacterized protein LOC125582234 [Brassica napus]|uniref:uncharacterized protein LOC125582234 n=1 Tax=Brassica napus TaxID=3708 RepID=UPI0020786AE5|nr:uncharacterized protein LOC125582234 [Brassica napus]